MSERLTRRQLMAASALSAVAATGTTRQASGDSPSTTQAASAATSEQAERKFQLGLVTFNLAADWDLPTLIERCEQAGYVAVELRSTHKHKVEPTLSKPQRAEVRKRFAASSVELWCLGSACDFHAHDYLQLAQNIDTAKAFINLAADVGAKAVKVRPNGLVKGLSVEQSLEQIGYSLRTVGEAAQSADIRICCEMHGKDTVEPARMRRIMEIANHPSVGVTWNSNEVDVKDGSVRESFDMMRGWIWNVHMADLTSKYPWREFFSLLRGAGYAGYTMMEAPPLASQDPKDILRFMAYYKALWAELSRPA